MTLNATNTVVQAIDLDNFLNNNGIARIGAPAFAVFCVATAQADPKTGLAWVSAEECARFTGQSLEATKEALSALHEAGMLKAVLPSS